MKTCTVGAQLFHTSRQTDRQTDMTKLIVAFRNFENAPKNGNHKMYSLDEYVFIVGAL